MSTRFCLAALLLSFFLTQGSTAFIAGLGVGNGNGATSYQVNTISSDSVGFTSSFMGSPMEDWITAGSSAFGHGNINQTTSYTTSSGSFASNHFHAENADININDQGTTFKDFVASVPNINMNGTNLLYDCTTGSNSGVKELKSNSDKGNIGFSGSLAASSSGSSIGTSEGSQTLINGSSEKFAYNGFGYADLKLRVDNGSLAMEPQPLTGNELMSWHLLGSGSLVEMFIQAVNKAGPYASIHAASPGFMEAYPSASVTYNGAEVKA